MRLQLRQRQETAAARRRAAWPPHGTATFPVGSHVRAKASKQKARFDNQRGEVVALLSKTARVKMLIGTAAGLDIYMPHSLPMSQSIQRTSCKQTNVQRLLIYLSAPSIARRCA